MFTDYDLLLIMHPLLSGNVYHRKLNLSGQMFNNRFYYCYKGYCLVLPAWVPPITFFCLRAVYLQTQNDMTKRSSKLLVATGSYHTISEECTQVCWEITKLHMIR